MSKTIRRTMILVVFFILLCRVFYLLPKSIANVPFDDITLVLYTLFCGVFFLIIRRKQKYIFTVPVLLMMGCVLISGYKGVVNYGQSLLYSITPQRTFLIITLSYFCLHKLFFCSKPISITKFFEYVINIGILEAVLYLAQHFLYPRIVFIDCQMNIRSGLRIYVDSVIIEAMIMLCFSQILRKRVTIKNMMGVALGLAHVFLVSQGRLESMAIVFTLLVSYMIYKKFDGKKIVLTSIIGIIAILVLNSGFITKLMSVQDTSSIRQLGHSIYFQQLFSNPSNLMFGCGYPNSSLASVVSGSSKYVYLADNGIFAFFYIYGIFGLLTLLAFLVKTIKLTIRMLKTRDEIFPVMFLIFNALISYNIIFWWWKSEWTVFWILYLCYLEYETAMGKDYGKE